jgi:hypothetical protein
MHVSDPDTWFIFNQHRELFFILDTHKNQAGAYLMFAKSSNLLGKTVPLKVNCPCNPCVSLTPCTCFLHTENLFHYTKTTLTSPVFLSGKSITIPKAVFASNPEQGNKFNQFFPCFENFR